MVETTRTETFEDIPQETARAEPEVGAPHAAQHGAAPATSSAGTTDEAGRPPPAPAGPPLSPRVRYLFWACGTLLACGAALAICVRVPTVSVPLLTAFIIAYMLDPIVDRLEARRLPRTAAIGVILGSFLLVGALLFALLLPQVIRELSQVPAALQQGLARLVPFIEGRFTVQVPTSFAQLVGALQDGVTALDLKSLAAPTGKLLQGVIGGTLGALSTLAVVVMVPVFAFYLLRDFDHIITRGEALIPHRFRVAVRAHLTEIDHAMSSFIRGQITVAAVLSVLYVVGLSFVGLPLAVVVGLIAGVGNLIPYVGTALGMVMCVSLSLLTQNPGITLLQVGAVFVIVQLLEGWVITPKVVGESIGLSSFTVIVAVLFFGELLGFVGVLIAVPLAAILKILGAAALRAYRDSAFYQEP